MISFDLSIPGSLTAPSGTNPGEFPENYPALCDESPQSLPICPLPRLSLAPVGLGTLAGVLSGMSKRRPWGHSDALHGAKSARTMVLRAIAQGYFPVQGFLRDGQDVLWRKFFGTPTGIPFCARPASLITIVCANAPFGESEPWANQFRLLLASLLDRRGGVPRQHRRPDDGGRAGDQ